MRTITVLALSLLVGCSDRALLPGGRADHQAEDAGVPADGGAADLGPRADAAPRPDAAPTGLCGNGVREGLEACDDGNTEPGDGCSAVCVYEGGHPPAFATLAWLNGAAMAVSRAGDTYITESGGGSYEPAGNNTAIHRIAADGTVKPRFLVYQPATYDVALQALGDGLVFGSFAVEQYNTDRMYVTVEAWQPDAGLSMIHHEHRTMDDFSPNAGPFQLAFGQDGHESFYAVGDIRRITAEDTSVYYLPPPGSVQNRHLRYHDGLGALLVGAGGVLYRDGGSGSLVTHHALPEGNIVDIAVAADGRIFVACAQSQYAVESAPCPSGAVWAIAADGSASRPWVDAHRTVVLVAWDPSTRELVYFGSDWVIRRAPTD